MPSNAGIKAFSLLLGNRERKGGAAGCALKAVAEDDEKPAGSARFPVRWRAAKGSKDGDAVSTYHRRNGAYGEARGGPDPLTFSSHPRRTYGACRFLSSRPRVVKGVVYQTGAVDEICEGRQAELRE
jgi:hypothetical protein